jgi:hypothetical protein
MWRYQFLRRCRGTAFITHWCSFKICEAPDHQLVSRDEPVPFYSNQRMNTCWHTSGWSNFGPKMVQGTGVCQPSCQPSLLLVIYNHSSSSKNSISHAWKKDSALLQTMTHQHENSCHLPITERSVLTIKYGPHSLADEKFTSMWFWTLEESSVEEKLHQRLKGTTNHFKHSTDTAKVQVHFLKVH